MSQTAENEPTAYWYNIKTQQVEVGPKSAAIYRVGPFASEAEARRAPELLRQRAEAWKNQDEAER